MFTWICVFLLCSWKIKTLFLKLEDQKVTDYAALKRLSLQLWIFFKKKNLLFESIVKVELSFIWPFLTYGLDKGIWKFTLLKTHNFGK